MLISVRFFASYADSLGMARTEVAVDPGARVSDLMSLIERLPGAGALPPNPLVAVNHSYAGPQTPLRAGDEVAVIPPVAGG